MYLILVSFNFLGSRYLRVPSGVLCTLHVHVDTRILLRLVLNITIILCCIFCHYFIRVYDMYHVCMRLVCCLWYVCVTHTSNFYYVFSNAISSIAFLFKNPDTPALPPNSIVNRFVLSPLLPTAMAAITIWISTSNRNKNPTQTSQPHKYLFLCVLLKSTKSSVASNEPELFLPTTLFFIWSVCDAIHFSTSIKD